MVTIVLCLEMVRIVMDDGSTTLHLYNSTNSTVKYTKCMMVVYGTTTCSSR